MLTTTQKKSMAKMAHERSAPSATAAEARDPPVRPTPRGPTFRTSPPNATATGPDAPGRNCRAGCTQVGNESDTPPAPNPIEGDPCGRPPGGSAVRRSDRPDPDRRILGRLVPLAGPTLGPDAPTVYFPRDIVWMRLPLPIESGP